MLKKVCSNKDSPAEAGYFLAVDSRQKAIIVTECCLNLEVVNGHCRIGHDTYYKNHKSISLRCHLDCRRLRSFLGHVDSGR